MADQENPGAPTPAGVSEDAKARFREALERNRSAAAELRADAMRRLPTELLDVAELEVPLAHLRVPETV